MNDKRTSVIMKAGKNQVVEETVHYALIPILTVKSNLAIER